MIYMCLADGCEEVEALAPLDLLRRAGAKIYTVRIGEGKTALGAHGIKSSAILPRPRRIPPFPIC